MLGREVLLEGLDVGELIGEVLDCGSVGDEGVGEGLRVGIRGGQRDGGGCEGVEGCGARGREVGSQRRQDVRVAGVRGDLPRERLLGGVKALCRLIPRLVPLVLRALHVP